MQLELGKSYKLTVNNDGIEIEEIKEDKPSKAKDFKYLRLNRAIFGTDYHPAEVAFKPKPEPKYYNGKVVCVACPDYFDWWTVGKVYNIVDGVIKDDDGEARKEIRSLSELTDRTDCEIKFIEYRGENA